MQKLRRNEISSLGVAYRSRQHVFHFIESCVDGTLPDLLEPTIIITDDKPFKVTLHYHQHIRPTHVHSEPLTPSIRNDLYLDSSFPEDVLRDLATDKHWIKLGNIPLGVHVAINNVLYYANESGMLQKVPESIIGK